MKSDASLTDGYRCDPFRETDVDGVVALWHRTFPRYYLSSSTLRRFTLDCSGLDARGCQVVRAGDSIVGFSLATDIGIAAGPLDEMPGVIPVILVDAAHHMRGIARKLPERGERYLASLGKKKARLGYLTYLQGTVLPFPGVNADWKTAYWFLRHYGYEVRGLLDSARCSLQHFTVPPGVQQQIEDAASAGITAGQVRDEDEALLMAFLSEHSRGWHQHFDHLLQRKALELENVTVLRQGGEIIAFAGPAAFAPSGEVHMGVGIGVDSRLRGQGLALTSAQMLGVTRHVTSTPHRSDPSRDSTTPAPSPTWTAGSQRRTSPPGGAGACRHIRAVT